MTQYCDYSTFQFTQALPGANEPIERVFFSMNNMWSGMLPNRRSKPKLFDWSPQKHQCAVLCPQGLSWTHQIQQSVVEWKALSGAREMETQRTDRQYSIGRGHKTLEMVLIWSNKKAVLSQRWPRDARYISRSCAVAEIWPFEITQDGGRRHLEFVRIENSVIRSAVPENHTL